MIDVSRFNVFKFSEGSRFSDSLAEMKLALASVCLVALLIGANSAPQTFNFGGMTGMFDATVNGEKASNVDPEMISKAEDAIKAMISKHLQKKHSKKNGRKEKVEAPEPELVYQAPEPELVHQSPQEVAQPAANVQSINWDEHAESRAILNEKVPGGTEAVDALIKLIKEKQLKQ